MELSGRESLGSVPSTRRKKKKKKSFKVIHCPQHPALPGPLRCLCGPEPLLSTFRAPSFVLVSFVDSGVVEDLPSEAGVLLFPCEQRWRIGLFGQWVTVDPPHAGQNRALPERAGQLAPHLGASGLFSHSCPPTLQCSELSQ